MPDLHVVMLIDALGWGGAEMLLSDLTLGAASAGVRVSVGYLHERDGSPAAERLRALGVEPRHVPISGLLDPRSVASVRRFVRDVGPDVVHTHLGYSDFLGCLAAGSLGLPAVSTIHLAHWNSARYDRDWLRFRLFALVRRRFAARVLTVSEAARRAYLDLRWDTADHVTTVHNGVRDGRRHVQQQDGDPLGTRRQLGLHPEDLVVTMLSVLRRGKGHGAAFDAVRHLTEVDPGSRVRLLVLGDGPDASEIRRAAADLGDRVVMPGHRDDVAALLAASDVLLHPSEADAFPTAVLEAMAADVPVVATAVGGIPEMVEDGVTGILLPLPPSGTDIAQALARLSEDTLLRRSMGRAGRGRYEEHFTTEAWAQRLRRVYEDVRR